MKLQNWGSEVADACLSHLGVLEKLFTRECELSLFDPCRLFALELLRVMWMWHLGVVSSV